MSQETCAVLAAIFPLVMITVVLERRAVALQIRRRSFFRRSTMAVVTVSVLGLLFAVIGVEAGGLTGVAMFAEWAFFAVSTSGLIGFGLTHMATTEAAEDAA